MDKNKLNTFAYQIGYIFSAIIVICLAATVIGVTVKFLTWLF